MPVRQMAFVVAIAMSLIACAASPDGTSPSATESTAAVIGTDIGGLLGNGIGAVLNAEDKRLAYAAQMDALNDSAAGAPVSWRNPYSGHHGTVVPGPYYEDNGRRCRSYTHSVYVNGRPLTVRRTACRDQNGNWIPLS